MKKSGSTQQTVYKTGLKLLYKGYFAISPSSLSRKAKSLKMCLRFVYVCSVFVFGGLYNYENNCVFAYDRV